MEPAGGNLNFVKVGRDPSLYIPLNNLPVLHCDTSLLLCKVLSSEDPVMPVYTESHSNFQPLTLQKGYQQVINAGEYVVESKPGNIEHIVFAQQ